MTPSIISVSNLLTKFATTVIHDHINFSIERGSIVAIIGGSGCGKSTLMREIIGLLRPAAGQIRVLGKDVWDCSGRALEELRRQFGVLFQNGALFSAISCGENVAIPLLEQTSLGGEEICSLVQLRLALTGLSRETALKMPSELSGGMRKRVALARALALEPQLLFLDEPTSGLDPISARSFDHLITTLSRNLGLTVVIITHDLDSIFLIADRVIVLGEQRILADGPPREVAENPHPWIQAYFTARAGI